MKSVVCCKQCTLAVNDLLCAIRIDGKTRCQESDPYVTKLFITFHKPLQILFRYGRSFKTSVEFNHLETGTWKLRHIMTYQRLLFHHNILSRNEGETIKKIYKKKNRMGRPR